MSSSVAYTNRNWNVRNKTQVAAEKRKSYQNSESRRERKTHRKTKKNVESKMHPPHLILCLEQTTQVKRCVGSRSTAKHSQKSVSFPNSHLRAYNFQFTFSHFCLHVSFWIFSHSSMQSFFLSLTPYGSLFAIWSTAKHNNKHQSNEQQQLVNGWEMCSSVSRAAPPLI
jgi:hypothetical protein